jgi:GWxTD domain-containing protein
MFYKQIILSFIFIQFLFAAEPLKWTDLQKNINSWIEGPVGLIATADEKQTFQRLQTPAEKMQFIKIFWARRDTVLRTRENEFKEAFYDRVDYANKNFAESQTPGWKTARGQVYIIFGPPSREDKRVLPDSSRPALLWVYDKIPSKEIPANEALLFLYRDFKYVLAPPSVQPGDSIGEEQRRMDNSFRYQSIPSLVQRAFADAAENNVFDKKKDYRNLLSSVEATEKFGMEGIEFEVRKVQADPLKVEVVLKKESAPVYDDVNKIFAELYFKQELKKGDRVVASNQHVASFSWDQKTFENLQDIVVPLPQLDTPADPESELWVTVQDRISNISETRKISLR